jgi:hypothetical protein
MDISTLGSCVAIVMICYIVGMGCKASKRISDEWIPVIMAVIGGILGAVGMGIIPDFPATDYIRSGTSMPSRFMPRRMTRATCPASRRRIVRVAASSSRRIEWSW